MFEVKFLHPRLVILCLVWFLFAHGCISAELRRQIEQSNQCALAANAARDELIVVYRAEGNAAIDHATDTTEAQRALQDVRRRWLPVWGTCDDDLAGPDQRCHDGAWPVLRDAQHAWATLLEQQKQGTTPAAALVQRAAAALQQSYCTLGSSLPQGVSVPLKIQAACEAPR